MTKKFLLSSIAVFILWLLFSADTDIKESIPHIPGAYKALEMFSYIRSYPYSDIPPAAYSEGYGAHKKLKAGSRAYAKSNTTEWEAMGPFNTAGRALSIAVNPQDPFTVYMASASGGLWRSRNLGLERSWEYMPTGYPVLGVSSIAFAPGDSMTMYIGTGEVYNFFSTGTDGAFRSTRGSYGIGILKSSDAGRTWEKSLDWSYQQNHGVWMVKVSQQNPETVYAATTQGIYKTVNGGEEWTQVLDVIMATDLEIDPRDDNRVIVSCGNFGTSGRGIYRTVDGGASWLSTPQDGWATFQGKILLARAPSNPDVLYASVGNGFGFDDGATWLLRTNDNGRNWVTVNTEDYSQWQGWFSHDISVHPDDENEIMAVGIDIFKSTDGGVTLERKTGGGVFLGTPPIEGPDGPPDYSHSDHHFVMHHPEINGAVLFGNDGGMFISMDGGESVRSANGGLQTTQFYNGFSVSRTNKDFAMGGLQDNSTVIYRGTGAWQRVIGGDGSWSAINQNDNNVIFGSYQNLNILKSSNNGTSFFNAGINFRPNERPLFISPYVISDSEPPVMYAGGVYIYRSENLAQSWEATNFGLPLNGDPAFCMDVHDSDPDIVYVGTVGLTDQPRIFRTSDGGDSWQMSSGFLPNRIPNDIAIHPFDPAIAYVCFSGFGTDHLFRTDNFGATWQPIGSGLPDVPVNALAIDPEDPSVMYLGNDISVYFSTDVGLNWEVLDTGLPDAFIAMDLQIDPVERKIWLATHGNGAYRADMLNTSVSTDDGPEAALDFKVYPNPTHGRARIEAAGSALNPTQMQWSLYDINSVLIMKGREAEFDISTLPEGTYFLELRNGKHRKLERLVKF